MLEDAEKNLCNKKSKIEEKAFLEKNLDKNTFPRSLS